MALMHLKLEKHRQIYGLCLLATISPTGIHSNSTKIVYHYHFIVQPTQFLLLLQLLHSLIHSG